MQRRQPFPVAKSTIEGAAILIAQQTCDLVDVGRRIGQKLACDPPSRPPRQHGHCLRRCRPVPCWQSRFVLDPLRASIAKADAGKATRGAMRRSDPRPRLALLQGAQGLEATAITASSSIASSPYAPDITPSIRCWRACIGGGGSFSKSSNILRFRCIPMPRKTICGLSSPSEKSPVAR